MASIGIDLGTTFSVTAYVSDDGKIIHVKDLDGQEYTPSFLYFKYDEKFDVIRLLVGKKAKDMMSIDPENVVSSYKTKMGSGIPVKVIMNMGITAEQCSAKILKYIISGVEKALGEVVTKCVISVPADFSEEQCEATKAAARLAKVPLVRLIPEPTAAAFHYALNPKNAGEEKMILAVDLGGGTLDIAIIIISSDGDTRVIATAGDTKMGGDDIDRCLTDYLLKQNGYNKEDFNINTYDKIIRYSENLKIRICNNPTEIINDKQTFDDIVINVVDFTYEKFVELIQFVLGRVRECIQEAFDRSGCTYEEIDDTILVGGSTRIPAIAKLIAEDSKNKFSEEYLAAYQVDPDLAVGLGAATYLKYINEGKEDILTNVIAHPIGVEDENGNMDVIINAGSVYPRTVHRRYYNAQDYQTEITLKVYEGISKIAKKNNLLATLKIPCDPGKRGTVTVMVKLSLDEDATLKVTCRVNGRTETVKVERKFEVKDLEFEHKIESSTSNAKW